MTASPAASADVQDVVIVGGGVCGTALLYCLSNYTNISSMTLIEKERDVALINSQKTSNSQTLHFGDIETNYTLEKAQKVNQAASLVKHYLLKHDPEQTVHSKYHKMVLGRGGRAVREAARSLSNVQDPLSRFADGRSPRDRPT